MKLFDHPLLAVKLLQEREDSETVIVVSMESGGGGGGGVGLHDDDLQKTWFKMFGGKEHQIVIENDLRSCQVRLSKMHEPDLQLPQF